MSNIVPFESAKLPSYLVQAFDASDDLGSSFASFPTMSIKGKVFTIKRDDEKTLVCRPGETDPAPSIEVVILKAFPTGNHYAKTFYAKGFTEGSEDQPTCYSDDGIAPAADAEEPQASKCAVCPMNIKGSKIGDDGKQGKACASSKKLAIAQAGAIGDPMLLRVPGASTIGLKEFGELLSKRKVPYQAVVTRISFDHTVAHPKLKFAPVGFVDESTMAEIVEMKDSELVNTIVGATPREPKPEAPVQPPASAPETKEPEKTPEKPAPTKPELPTKPRTRVKVAEAPAEEAPVAAAPEKPTAKPSAPVIEDADAGMGSALDDLDFDD